MPQSPLRIAKIAVRVNFWVQEREQKFKTDQGESGTGQAVLKTAPR